MVTLKLNINLTTIRRHTSNSHKRKNIPTVRIHVNKSMHSESKMMVPEARNKEVSKLPETDVTMF